MASATGLGGAGAAGGVEMAVATEGEAMGGFEAGMSLGTSVEEAISSSRDVAASRLDRRLAPMASYISGQGRWEGRGAAVPLDERSQVVHVVRSRHGEETSRVTQAKRSVW